MCIRAANMHASASQRPGACAVKGGCCSPAHLTAAWSPVHAWQAQAALQCKVQAPVKGVMWVLQSMCYAVHLTLAQLGKDVVDQSKGCNGASRAADILIVASCDSLGMGCRPMTAQRSAAWR